MARKFFKSEDRGLKEAVCEPEIGFCEFVFRHFDLKLGERELGPQYLQPKDDLPELGFHHRELKFG